MVVGMAGAILALSSGSARAQNAGEQGYCNDGCTWTLVCEWLKYECGSNADDTPMWCYRWDCWDKCENCPGDRPVDLDTIDVPRGVIGDLSPLVNPIPF